MTSRIVVSLYEEAVALQISPLLIGAKYDLEQRGLLSGSQVLLEADRQSVHF